MAFTFSDIRSEVKRRATKNQGGTSFDTGINNTINTSMWRIARESRWRSLRRIITFNTVEPYTTGTGAVTLATNSSTVSISGATLITDNIRIGRYISLSGSSKKYKISTITGETGLTLNRQYVDGTNTSSATYSILGQEEYILPIQVGHSAFFWHEEYGYPLLLDYVPTQEFFRSGTMNTIEGIPYTYRMWGADSVLEQLISPSVITISSSSSSDTSKEITVFGIVSGYPDYEIINTNSSDGTTSTAGSKTFSSVERITKNSSTTGRITCTANSGNTTVAVMPVGNTTSGPMYTKIQLYPLPDSVFPVNCFYYKLPYQLVNNGDVPELGEEFVEAIILLATAKMNAEQNKKEDADFMSLYDDEIKSLKRTNVDKIDWLPKLKRPDGSYMNWETGISPSQVGSSGTYGWSR